MLLLEPSNKVIICALEFDVPQASVAEYVASDAHMRLVAFFNLQGRDFENFLNSFSSFGIDANLSMICLSLDAVRRTKDDLSLSIVQNSCFIALIGLNFIGVVGIGKNAWNVRLRLRITKLFVTGRAWVVRGVVCVV